jgi:hypothetical protein
MNWLKKILTVSLVLALTSCAGVDLQPYWDAFQAWNETYNQPQPPAPVIPVPVPDPPKPPEVPPPVPVEESRVLFDLPQTALEMGSLWPCREGVCLYALAQVSNGWPIPGQSDELILIASFYPQIQEWYDFKISGIVEKLKLNPGLTVTILANDAKDRFGCRIGPATMGRLSAFGDRVQMGYFVPESEY